MFGLTKREIMNKLRAEIDDLKNQAICIYNQKNSVENQAFYALAELARENGVSASQAAETPEGVRILSEVVLNRQYYFYLNEMAIQHYAKLQGMANPDWFDISNKNQWFDDVVSPAGSEIVLDQINETCGNLISDVDEYLK